MFSNQVIRISLVAAILGCSFPQFSQTREEEVDRQVYQRGLVALKNIIDVRDELEERLEGLSDKEKKIGDEKRELRMVVKDIDGVFPKGKENLSVRARGFARRIRDIDQEDERHMKKAMARLQESQQQPVVKLKSGKGVIVGVLVGALVSLAAGFFFWKVGNHKSSKKKTNNCDAMFIDSLTKYVERVR